MATIRIGATTKQGVYKNVVLNIGREVKVGIGYVEDTRLEQSYLNTLEMLESTIIRGDDGTGRQSIVSTGVPGPLAVANFSSVPEPNSLAIFAIGSIGIFWSRRRR